MNPEKSPVVLIVGGAGGIGSAVARRLAARGCQLVLAARNVGRLEAVAVELGAQALPLGARDGAAVDALMASVQASQGRVDGVVNCAGSILLKPAHLITDQEFAETLATNLTTAFNLVCAATRLMMKQAGGGSIVLGSSVAARRGLVNHEAISAAKFTLRTELGFDAPLYQLPLLTASGEWREHRLPFADFLPTFRGRALSGVPPFSAADVTSVGFLIAHLQAGEFRLEIDWIKAVREMR